MPMMLHFEDLTEYNVSSKSTRRLDLDVGRVDLFGTSMGTFCVISLESVNLTNELNDKSYLVHPYLYMSAPHRV